MFILIPNGKGVALIDCQVEIPLIGTANKLNSLVLNIISNFFPVLP